MKADALRGHLDSLILATVEDQPRHGYAIIEALAAARAEWDQFARVVGGVLRPA